MELLRKIYKFFSSYLLAVIVLVLLTLITLLGTLEQGELGLFTAVNKYFHSWFVVCDLLKFPLPLPGGLLLMIILFINMTLGALVHVRKRFRGIPNLVSHCGILFLLISAFVTFVGKNDAYVALFPGQLSNVARDYKKWELEIIEFNEEKKPVKSHIVTWDQLTSIGEGKSREFTAKDLPFSVSVDSFMVNATPVSATSPLAAGPGSREVGAFKLMERKKNKEEAANYPGCLAKVLVGDDKKTVKEAILSAYCTATQYTGPDGTPILMQVAGHSPRAAGFEVDGKQYGLLLNKTGYPVDFYIKLDKFIFEKHPGTSQPKNYESRITRMTAPDDEGKKVAIRMNIPMRHSGFVVFQESFGQHPRTGEYYSQFAVSNNPSDQWPTIALFVMMLGLSLHFVWKLIEYINKSKVERLKNGEAKS